jgi:hypothetical protein
MPPTPSRYPRRSSNLAAPPTSPGTVGLSRPTLARPSATSGLKVLAAGVDKDERGRLETTVRDALAPRLDGEPWVVSLVRLASRWSVTLNGPDEPFRNVSFIADDARLGEALRDAVDTREEQAAPPPPAPGVGATPSPGEVRDTLACPQCRRGLVVAYETFPGEPKEPAPLACPHCWQITHVEIGSRAAATADYRAEKA